MKYDKLFNPIKLGKVEIKNRVFMSPMQTNLSQDIDGRYTDRYIEYFRERAKNEVGLIITCHIKAEKKIDPYPIAYKFPCIDSPGEIKYFSQLTEAVHDYGAKIAIQLSPGTGRIADMIMEDYYPKAPSEVPLLINPNMKSKELTKEEIKELIKSYGKAAGYAKAAGFDLIYIHSTAYLIDQFLSPCWNHRNDEYGGSLENRMRFMLECIESARENVGYDFPIMAGFTMNQGVPGGRTLEENIAIAKKLEEIGIVALHLRHGSYDAMNLLIPTNLNETEIAVSYAEDIKKAVNIPVLTDGALLNPDTCEKILENGNIDMVGLGRPLLADPEWIKKAKEDRAEDIRPCLRCMECINRSYLGKFSGCSVNPKMGREYEGPIMKTDKAKKVLVIGGGLAGIACSMLLDEKGHSVTLAEKSNMLGGHIVEGSIASFKKETASYLKWLEGQIEKSNVDVKLNTKVDSKFIKSFNPDAVVICTGSVSNIPNVPGVEKENVRLATDVLLDDSSVGENVVIVGSGLVGCETAIENAQKGRNVTLIDMTPEIGMDIIYMVKYKVLDTLYKSGVKCFTGLRLSKITDNGIEVIDSDDDIKEISADTVILATGLKPDNSLYNEVSKKVNEIYVIGDCKAPRKFINATREAYAVAKVL